MKADLCLYNADVLTLDRRRPRAQLVAVAGGRIIRVGANEERSEYSAPQIDCEGKALVPGFIDAHCHLFALASSLLSVDCSPQAVGSIADIVRTIAAQARAAAPGTWIRATGYNEFYLAEGRHPTRWDLDEAAPHNPVRLAHRSGHASVLNSMALSLVGISMESAEPPGGMIERDLESGEPNGILYEMNHYIDGLVPPLSTDELEGGIRQANERLVSVGVTSLQDATVHSGPGEWEGVHGLKVRGLLAPRISMMMDARALDELGSQGFHPRRGDDDIRLGALKVVLDETTGALFPGQEELCALVLAAHRAGYQLAIHAVEERAVAAAGTALEGALAQAPRAGHRHRVEHCSVCPPPLLERLKRIHAVVVTNPSFIYFSGERYLKTVPPEQLPWLYRIGSFLRSGLVPAAGSDCPVAPVDPLKGIYAATTRRAASGDEVLPHERISPLEALRMHTQSAAYALFEEGGRGTIREGLLADLALLSADPTSVPSEALTDIRVEMTICGGSVAWRA